LFTKRTAVFLRTQLQNSFQNALIHKDFEDDKVLVKEQLKGNTIALTTDIWTSRATQAFTITATWFIDK